LAYFPSIYRKPKGHPFWDDLFDFKSLFVCKHRAHKEDSEGGKIPPTLSCRAIAASLSNCPFFYERIRLSWEIFLVNGFWPHQKKKGLDKPKKMFFFAEQR